MLSPSSLSRLTSVTRWLIVVVFGCAVLETAQPMNAAEAAPAPGARSGDTVVFPRNAPGAPSATPASSGGGSYFLGGAFVLALAGGALLLRRRARPPRGAGRRLLNVEETKSLGGRQYLVVAACEGRRFLLGVTPGRIQLLSPLDDAGDAADPAP